VTATRPSVSVLIPAFNAARFLAEALDSVERQSLRPFEVVVVDDESEDGSAEIASSRHGVICVRQRHGGEAAARNTALARARGELVAFLDADDRWHPEKLERQVAVLLREPERPGVLCHFRNFFDSRSPQPEWLRPEAFLTARAGSMPSLCTLLARRTAFDAVGPFRTEMVQGTDLDWFVRATDAGLSFAMLPEVLVDRRLHDANLSYGGRGDSRVLLRVLRDSIARKRRAARAGEAADAPTGPSEEGGGP
jgi:glycosyltransferase involved in cell wall biosynthesis